MDRARCPTHGLLLGGDGWCLRCRRDGERGKDRSARLALALIVGLPLVAIGGARAVLSVRDRPATASAEPSRPFVPPPPAATRTPVDTSTAPGTAAEREQRVQEEIRNVPVTVYAADYCPWCRKAKAHLDARGISYVERKVDVSPEAKRDMARIGGRGIPTIDIEGDVSSGYDPGWIDKTVRVHAEQRVALLP